MTHIKHETFVNLYNKDQQIFQKLFKDINNLTKLSNRIIKLSSDFQQHNYPTADKMKGDLFEIFAESFFKIFAADNRIGVYNFEPIPSSDDNGVDGKGVGMDGKPLTVQVKFRSDSTSELISEDIKQFPLQSILLHDVDKNTKTNLILFTNAKGMHFHTESKVFLGAIKTIAQKEISFLVDNNTVFWKMLNDLIEETIKFRYS